MKRSSLRDYPAFVQAVADFIVQHGLTLMPTPGVYRRLGAEILAHSWRKCHRHGGHDLRADVEARLGHKLADAPAKPPARHLYADYPFYLGELRAHAREQGLTHVPSRKELGHGPLGVHLARHRDAHDLAADLGLPYRLGAEDIPAAYLREDKNLRGLVEQFLAINGLAHVPHEQQLYLYRHYKHLRALVAPRLTDGFTWPALMEHLCLTMDPRPPRKRPEDYTTAEVIEEVRALCARLGHFPSAAEFRHLGHDYLLARVRARYGKASVLARQLGYDASGTPWVAQDGHLCASYGEVRTDDALARLGVAHQPQGRLVPGKRYSADFAVRGPQGRIAVESLMVDPEQPRSEVPRCVQYLTRFARKAEAYRRHGVALVVVVPARYATDAALEAYLRGQLASYGVTFGEPELLSTAPVAGEAEQAGGQKPPGYWTLFPNVLKEVQAILEAHGLREVPNMGYFARIGRYDLKEAIHKYWGREAIGAALGLPVAPRKNQPVGFWRNLDHVAAAVREYVRERVPASDVFPSASEVKGRKQYPLANALAKLTDKQLDELAARTGLVRKETVRKPPGFWQVRANVVRELAQLAAEQKLTAFPGAHQLQKLGRSDLIRALGRFTPQELDALALETGLTRKARKPKPRQ